MDTQQKSKIKFSQAEAPARNKISQPAQKPSAASNPRSFVICSNAPDHLRFICALTQEQQKNSRVVSHKRTAYFETKDGERLVSPPSAKYAVPTARSGEKNLSFSFAARISSVTQTISEIVLHLLTGDAVKVDKCTGAAADTATPVKEHIKTKDTVMIDLAYVIIALTGLVIALKLH